MAEQLGKLVMESCWIVNNEQQTTTFIFKVRYVISILYTFDFLIFSDGIKWQHWPVFSRSFVSVFVTFLWPLGMKGLNGTLDVNPFVRELFQIHVRSRVQ